MLIVCPISAIELALLLFDVRPETCSDYGLSACFLSDCGHDYLSNGPQSVRHSHHWNVVPESLDIFPLEMEGRDRCSGASP
jgi:hypothetical protein